MSKGPFITRKSLVTRMLFAVIAVIVLVLALLTVFSVIREHNKAKTGLLEQGKMLAELLSRNSTIGVFSENKKMLADAAKHIIVLKDVVGLSVYTSGLKKLYEERKGQLTGAPLNKPAADDLPAIRSVIILETPETFQFIRPVLLLSGPEKNESLYFGLREEQQHEKVIGYVRIVLSKDNYHKEIASVIKQNAVTLLAFIWSGIVIVYFTIRTVTRPLVTLTEKVKAVGMGLPVDPVPVETSDEVGNLAASFNEMVRARGEAEKLLRESEERYRQLVELSPDAVYVQQMGRIVFINEAGARLLGAVQKEEILHRPASGFVHASCQDALEVRALEAEQEGRLTAPLPVQYVNKNGKVLEAEVAIAPFIFDQAPAALVIARDQTDRRGMEDKIRHYEKQLFAAAAEMSSLESRVEERERHLIAGDLHDYVGQNLAVLSFKMGRVRSAVQNGQATQELETMREILEQTIQYTRSLTVELNPPVLVELGFRSAVQSLCEAFEQRHGIVISVKADNLGNEIQGDAGYLLFRCVRELLLNVVKHAGATTAAIFIETRNSTVRVTVEDNGIGYDRNKPGSRNGSFGLFSIRNRLKRLGGSVEIEGKPGKGTRVTLRAPLENQGDGEKAQYGYENSAC